MILGLALNASGVSADYERTIVVASTTSTANSGLFEALMPRFTEETGIIVHVVAVGTGQAIRIAKAGDADVLFVHDEAAEQAFVAAGYGTERRRVMYNDFIIVGPSGDPAGVRGMSDAPAALARIAQARAIFASRGDDSGTNRAELRLWAETGTDPKHASGTWYRETGSGMGATLNTASGLDAYALTDRGTWVSFGNKGDLEVLVQGDQRLFNQYGVITVNPERFPHVKAVDARRFMTWLTSDEGQGAIASYRVDGQQLFFANYLAPGS
ncbi:MAG: substrate-binding domain-containing protein [Proteobacteria bacterium]|nr:substrate-binding domain-containing protein [Pseudomonadota bacterium]